MYQAIIPSPIMMQVVGSQQTNGQCPVQTRPHPSPNPSNDPHQIDRRISSYSTNGNYSNKHRLTQHNTRPIELYPMMRVDNTRARKSYGGGNWNRRNTNNSQHMPSPNNYHSRLHNNNNRYGTNNNHDNYRNTNSNNNPNNSYKNNNNNNNINNSNINNNENNTSNNNSINNVSINNDSSSNKNNSNSNNNDSSNYSGSTKKQNWNNRSNRRNTLKDHLPLHKENRNNYNCDSGFSSRSPTPNKHQSDHAESSDDRESIGSNARPNIKKFQDIWPNPMSTMGYTPSRHLPNIPNISQFPNQQIFGFYPTASNYPMRIQIHQNFPGKKRVQTNKNSPATQKNQKKRRNMNIFVPTFANVLPTSHLPPDRYLARSHLIEVKEVPKNLFGSKKWDNLSKEIWEMFMENQQNEQTFKKKITLWKYLFIFIKTMFPKFSLFLVGSTMNGFGTNSSDADICLLTRNAEIIQRAEAIIHLDALMHYLGHCDFIQDLQLIQAKVPILKFKDAIQKLDIDLNCNNAVGVRNTHMLYCYSRIDWRVRPLVLIVKLWAQSQNINDAKNMTISSYSLALMVIHFLQCGVDPPVLPCLQTMFESKFNPNSDVHTINIHEDLEIKMEKINEQPLGELLLEFFKYYAHFKYDRYAISVRLARRVLISDCQQARTLKNNPHQWKFLCIEEPFDLTNTARSVYDYHVFLRIKAVFFRSYETLKKTNNLASIFVNQVPPVNEYFRAMTSN
ncbi:poly(A) RNA polymerase GLD2-like [Chelonus insularis]|uniref:poly(A) RNA polymerase GLD2-like n=1 Tax=Chelonus insularis TaxID=460826 RepID=UPI00158C594E|nr:poly(A) RNA polymerase GLD2-like [Chelonus insularis]